jgi:hypothetical protein
MKRKMDKKKETRITKQELEKIYGVDRTTIEVWRKRYGLPIIEISSHSRYIRREDLIEWEDSLKNNPKVKS